MKTWRAAARYVALLDNLYAFADLPVAKAKRLKPCCEYHLRQAFATVRDELMLDGDSRRNLTPPIKPFPIHWDC